ncbi:unhealthy ribosome biogenesis protein 2 homolog [Pristis pectinata]|uniref:unhealthy ribosome biogenesis protein 2 homolog n=1 Tax=Pristis pectinata TaxID=685728 RepID=UPI00223D6AB5|nr:unhealthy ribosome biogenesis protein 2 homolog [Pristis pectinata]
MAAIYSGIHLKLKSVKTPWEDKLKLARFAWISHQCFLPNKEQVLLDWVSHALTGYYSKKLQFGGEIVEGLWSYLDDVLHSKKLQKLMEKGKVITIRFTIPQIINERILTCSNEEPLNVDASILPVVLSCCQGILAFPAFSIIYTSKCELLVDLLCKLCWLACRRLKSSEALHSAQLFDVLLLVFNQYLVLQRQQTNQSRMFLQVCGSLLQPFLLLRHLLSSRCWMGEDEVSVRQRLSKEICSRIQTVLQNGLFHTDFLNSYREELLQSDGSQGKKTGFSKGLTAPIETILLKLADAAFFGSDLHSAVVASSVPMLYKLSVESYCKDGNQLLCFHIFTKFLDSLRFPEAKSAEDRVSMEWNPGLLALDQLLNLIFTNNIYNISVDKIRCEGVQFTCYSRVAEMLLTHPRPGTAAWFRCLRTLILLNHLIMEPNLDELVSLAWVDADVSDPRAKKAQDSLLSTLLETYTKLRQLPRVFKEVLDVVSRPAADELRQSILSSSLSKKLQECLLEVTNSQVLDIWDLILKNLELLIPDLVGNSDTALKVLTMSSLLHTILFNMKTLDSKTPVPVILSTQALMNRTVQAAVMPLLHTGKHADGTGSSVWAMRAMSAGLILSSTWVEVDHLLQLNCSKYVSPSSQADGAGAEAWNFCCLLPQVSAAEWKLVAEVTGQGGELSQHFLQLLSVQKMKRIMMRPGEQTEAEGLSLRSSAAFVVSSGKAAVQSARARGWDRELSTLNGETCGVAHWHLVTTNLALLVPCLPQEEVTYIAEVVITNLLQKGTREVGQDTGTLLSIPAMCESLLNSTLLPEIQALHQAILLGLTQRVRQLVIAPGEGLPTGLLKQLAASVHATRGEGHQSSSSNWGLLFSHPMPSQGTSPLDSPQSIFSSIKSPSLLTLSVERLDALLQILDVLSALRLDSLSCTDHLQCFLLLVSLVTNLKPSSEESQASKYLQVLGKCYFLLTVLVTGTKGKAVFRLAHAGDVLEKVIAPLFLVSSELSPSLDCPAWPELLHTLQCFLSNFVQKIVERKQSMCLNLEQFIAFLSNTWVNAKVNEECKLVVEQLLMVALLTLSCVIQTTLQQSEKNRHKSSTLPSLLTQLSGLLGPVLQSHFDRSGLDWTFIVPCATALLEAELCPREQQSDAVSEGRSPDETGLKYSNLYQSICSQVLHQLTTSTHELDPLRKQLEFLRVFCSSLELCSDHNIKTGIPSIFCAVKALLAAPWITSQFIQSLDTQLIGLVTCMSERCTDHQFYLLVKSITQGIEVANLWKGRHLDVVSSLILTTILMKCSLMENAEKTVWFTAPQIITALLVLCKKTALDEPLGCKITLLSLEALAVLIQQGEGILSNPHYVTLAFDALLCIPLDQLKLDEYASFFQAIHEVLFSIIQSQPKVLLNAAPTFLKCFNRLVLSVIHKSRQKGAGEKGMITENEVILDCARQVERMYTHIASKPEEFAMFSAFMVAEYINELQKVTLNADVKKLLTGGVYHLLDLVTESDLRFLNALLQLGVREVFKELHSDYVRYHKSKRQGEEEYTA